jgi:DNA-binding response OmpR family regulator
MYQGKYPKWQVPNMTNTLIFSKVEKRLPDKPLVLVVDDNEKVVDMLTRALNRSGYRTACAYNGQAALDLIANESPSVVLLDIVMEGLDGLQVCERIRELKARKEIVVIIISSKGNPESIAAGLDIGADDYLPKPFSIDELLARMRAVLRRKGIKTIPNNQLS